MPIHDYGPPLPQPPSAVKLPLEFFADEVVAHASSAHLIYGLTPTQTETYKRSCFEAGKALRDAANVLRQAGVQPLPVVRRPFFGAIALSFLAGAALAVALL